MIPSIVFRNAIAMNNMATTLMKNRMYDDAYNVFFSAMHSFRFCALQNDLKYNHHHQQQPQFEVHSMHAFAERCVCASTGQTSTNSDHLIIIEPLYYSDLDCYDSAESIVESHTNSDCLRLYPIYIDRMVDSISTGRSNTNIDFECAILFYNCAIAHFCRWFERSTTSNFDSAIQLLVMGHKICIAEISNHVDDDRLWSTELTGFVFVETCILSTLTLLARMIPSKLVQEGQFFHVQLDILLSAAKAAATNDSELFGSTQSKSASVA
jgi:hypothetical protein